MEGTKKTAFSRKSGKWPIDVKDVEVGTRLQFFDKKLEEPLRDFPRRCLSDKI